MNDFYDVENSYLSLLFTASEVKSYSERLGDSESRKMYKKSTRGNLVEFLGSIFIYPKEFERNQSHYLLLKKRTEGRLKLASYLCGLYETLYGSPVDICIGKVEYLPGSAYKDLFEDGSKGVKFGNSLIDCSLRVLRRRARRLSRKR